MNMSAEITELAKALCLVQAEMDGAVKNKSNPIYNSKFADLESCINASRPYLTKHGLSVVQSMEPYDPGVIIVTYLIHTSGQFISSRLAMIPNKPGPHGIGTCISYGRRYSYASIIGLYQEDHDGNKADNTKKVSEKASAHVDSDQSGDEKNIDTSSPDPIEYGHLAFKKAINENGWTEAKAYAAMRNTIGKDDFLKLEDKQKKTVINWFREYTPDNFEIKVNKILEEIKKKRVKK